MRSAAVDRASNILGSVPNRQRFAAPCARAALGDAGRLMAPRTATVGAISNRLAAPPWMVHDALPARQRALRGRTWREFASWVGRLKASFLAVGQRSKPTHRGHCERPLAERSTALARECQDPGAERRSASLIGHGGQARLADRPSVVHAGHASLRSLMAPVERGRCTHAWDQGLESLANGRA